jgi:hypothetical protein
MRQLQLLAGKLTCVGAELLGRAQFLAVKQGVREQAQSSRPQHHHVLAVLHRPLRQRHALAGWKCKWIV